MLHNFTGGSDGGNPILLAAMAIDAHGNPYGATYRGGAGCGGVGCGVIFEMARGTGGRWAEGVLFDITDIRTQGFFDGPWRSTAGANRTAVPPMPRCSS